MNRDFFSTFEIYSIVIDFYPVIVVLSGLIAALILLYYLFKSFRLPVFNVLQKEKEEKISLDLKDPKKTAYKVTFLIYKYDTPYNDQLLHRLERFKYRKKVEKLDNETVELIKKFIEHIKEYGHRI
ncbi:hypothetical protein [Persephonella sp.]